MITELYRADIALIARALAIVICADAARAAEDDLLRAVKVLCRKLCLALEHDIPMLCKVIYIRYIEKSLIEISKHVTILTTAH